MERISLVTGFPMDNSEDLQLLHYTPGQYYKIHHDYIAAHAYGPSGPRVLTFFLYLNDVEEGGGTRFPALSPNAAPVTVQPKAGKALLWPSVLDENIYEKDERTEHEALTVTKGVKFGANAWLHLRDEQNVHGIECG
jgi:prolyl 4-hydroxylase